MCRPKRSFLTSTCVAAALVTVCADRAHLQAPPQPIFRAGVEVVLIDVSVVDKSAHPVSDLKAGDFVVTVDRKPRTIVSAVYTHHGVRSPSPERAETGGPAASPATPEQPEAAAPSPVRNVILVVDEDSLDAGHGLVAKRAAAAFLERLPATDRVAVMTIPRIRNSMTLSVDRDLARKSLDGVIAGRDEQDLDQYLIGISEAYAMENHDTGVIAEVVSRECKCQYPRGCPADCVHMVTGQAHQMTMIAQTRAQRSLNALQTMAGALRRLAGPKTLVLVSGGMPPPESTRSFSDVEQAFAAAQITLYTLYIERMQLGQSKARRLPPNPAADDRLEGFGVENVTSAAGGTLIPVVGTVEPAFERVANEMAGSYMVGIEVTSADRDGRPHQVAVKVKRPSVEVRARKQYVIEAAKGPL